MKQIQLKEVPPSTPCDCQSCGGQLRLIGSERHPVQDNTDLLTYACKTCGDFLVLPVASSPKT